MNTSKSEAIYSSYIMFATISRSISLFAEITSLFQNHITYSSPLPGQERKESKRHQTPMTRSERRGMEIWGAQRVSSKKSRK